MYPVLLQYQGFTISSFGVMMVIAFLLASPWANLPLTLLLIGFFGLKALLIIGCAIIVALITGFLFQLLESKGHLEEKIKPKTQIDPSFSIYSDIKTRFHHFQFSADWILYSTKGIIKGMWSLSKMVLWWILIGMMV